MNKFKVLDGGAVPKSDKKVKSETKASFKDGDDGGEYCDLTHILIEVALNGYIARYMYDDATEVSEVYPSPHELIKAVIEELG